MSTPPVVVDASLAVYTVLNTPFTAAAAQTLVHLSERGSQLAAPGLWWYEVSSVIHRYQYAGLITPAVAYAALDLLTVQLGMQPVKVTERAAFDWATRLGHKAAYDGFYLAAAEQLNGELWTADQSLVNNARHLGVGWVHWMGEMN